MRTVTELPRPTYRPSLDGIRGVAILAVLIYHCGLLSGGFLGVDVFFTLSGFLITNLLLAEYAATGRISFRHFYARRALRLLPALGGLLVSGGLVLLAAYPEFWRLIGLYVAAVFFYVANWAMIAGWGLGIFGHACGNSRCQCASSSLRFSDKMRHLLRMPGRFSFGVLR
jgi:peptidoglycan/LPS O-acetylase OafA/YrhL